LNFRLVPFNSALIIKIFYFITTFKIKKLETWILQ